MHRIALLACLFGCSETTLPAPDPRPPIRIVDAGEPASRPPPRTPTEWSVRVSAQAPQVIRALGGELVRYLGRMGLDARLAHDSGLVPCRAAEGVVALVGDGFGTPTLGEDATDQTWRIEARRCGDGDVVVLEGGGLLGRQYAAYAWLHAIGVRFFHPEHEYVPPAPRWPEPMDRTHTPAFRYRGASLELAHPIELGDPLRRRQTRYAPEVRRYIDWGIKNFASDGLAGPDGYGVRRGLLRRGSLHLEAMADQQSIAGAIDAEMADPERRPEIFSVTFEPDAEPVVARQLSLFAEHFAANYPDTLLFVVNPGDRGGALAGVPEAAPSNLGVKVQPLMFYGLEGSAPVHGNTDFGFLFEFMERTFETRNLIYFPQSAWWRTFDIAVPLYLPIAIRARGRDIEKLAFMLDGKLLGHEVLSSGHEWGYWQSEYCSYRMAADLDYGWRDCLADLVSPLGEAAAEVQAIVEAQIELQAPLFSEAEVLRWIVGSAPEAPHPLPATPAEIGLWDLERIARWRVEVAGPLTQSLDAHYALIRRLERAAAKVPADGRSWFAEIADGISANTVRLQHQLTVYDALITRREAELSGDEALLRRARALLEVAFASTESAVEIVRRREASYRYRPLERAVAGGPSLDADENWTRYPYRYLAPTHHAVHYRRIDARARAVFDGLLE